MIALTPTERRRLRAAAHALQPVVSIASKGLTEAVLREIARALAAHELIKVRVYGEEREARAALLDEICSRIECAPVQQIGNILVLWRPAPKTDEEAVQPPSPSRRRRKLSKKQAAAAWAAQQSRRR